MQTRNKIRLVKKGMKHWPTCWNLLCIEKLFTLSKIPGHETWMWEKQRYINTWTRSTWKLVIGQLRLPAPRKGVKLTKIISLSYNAVCIFCSEENIFYCKDWGTYFETAIRNIKCIQETGPDGCFALRDLGSTRCISFVSSIHSQANSQHCGSWKGLKKQRKVS